MMGFAKFAPLMYLAGKRLEDLTMVDLQKVTNTLGLEVKITSELQQAALGLLQGKDIHTVSDMIQSPESVTQLINLLRGQGVQGDIAVAEVDDMYSADSVMYSLSDDESPPSIVPVRANVPRQSRLISSPITGWRLPGESHSIGDIP